MKFRVRLQLAEAFGSINRWFCSEFYGRKIDDPELLVIYYVRSGGAADFAQRYDEAMGTLNRWYCSEFYRRDIRDPQILWDYYVNHAPARALGKNPRHEPDRSPAELSIAC
ncbi:MAG: hypothetical protein ABSH08_20275 [Tepidisphaeraceae bacterium]|jgi:hypothetical protein